MNDRGKGEQFNRALDDLLEGNPLDESQLSLEDRQALQLARQLAGEDFGGGREQRSQLRTALAARAEAEIGRPSSRRRLLRGFQALYRPAAWTGLALVLVLLLAWAFQNLATSPTPAATQQASETSGVASATPAEAVGIAPSFTPTPQQAEPSPTPAVPAPGVGPILTSPGLYFLGWSPDGAWLAYLTQTELDLLDSPVGEGIRGTPPGTIHFLNTQTGEDCQYPQENENGLLLNRWFAWLPGGRLITLTTDGGLVAKNSPCQEGSLGPVLPPNLGLGPLEEVYAASQDNQVLLTKGGSTCWIVDLRQGSATIIPSCSPEASFSPDESYLSVDIAAEPEYRTDVYRLAKGELAGSVDWQFSVGGLGFLPPPEWLDESRFVIYRTDQGPLMVDVEAGFQTQPIAPTLFGIEGHAYQYPDVLVSPDSDNFHLLLTDPGPEASGEQTRLYLYHSENEQVEELPYVGGSFAPGGNLSLLASSSDGGSERSSYWLRPVDPPGNEARLFASEEDQAYLGISPDGVLIARASPSSDQLRNPPAGSKSEATITVFEANSGSVLHEWLVDAYTFTFAFSPDNRSLAAVGTPVSGGLQALYLLPLEQGGAEQ